MKKKEYITPKCKVVNIEFSQMLANSITGSAPDSDDSEFGTNHRRGWSTDDFGGDNQWNHEC